jgi:hypothetical protein
MLLHCCDTLFGIQEILNDTAAVQQSAIQALHKRWSLRHCHCYTNSVSVAVQSYKPRAQGAHKVLRNSSDDAVVLYL